MRDLRTRMVDIARDFLVAHQELTDLFLAFQEGRLRFEDVHRLVGDDHASVLFRLKECCHAVFRSPEAGSMPEMRREALFDLAVGSLFHETMKLRENLYQQEFYVPRVRSLRADGAEADEEAAEILEEFEKILAASAARLEEAVNETRVLLTQTRQQLRLLMEDHRENGLMARCLYEEEPAVAVVFDEGLDGLFTRIFGSPFDGYMTAARSYLDSAYFSEALTALGDARVRAEGRSQQIHHLACYAEGMQAFLAGSYGPSVERLRDWLDGGLEEDERGRVKLALGAVSTVPKLAEGEALELVLDDAKQLSDRLTAASKR